MRMAELAEQLVFTRSGITRLIERLERRGYVERRECSDDARGVNALLTEQGFLLFEQAARTHVALKGYFPFWRPPIVRFQCAENPSASEAMDWRSTSPNVEGIDGVSRT